MTCLEGAMKKTPFIVFEKEQVNALQKAKFFVPIHHSLFPVAVKNLCPVVSHPTPFLILIIVEIVLVLNMHEILATGR